MFSYSNIGYVYVMTAAIFWASSGTVAKILLQGGMTPYELVQIRVTLAAIFLGTAFALFARRLFRIRFSDAGLILLIGIVMALVQVTYFYTISKMQVMAAILIQYMAPIIVAFFSICFWGEQLTSSKLLALFLAMCGCYLVVGGYNLHILHLNHMGILGGLASALCFAAYTLLGERAMHRYEPWTLVFYSLLISTFIWHIIYSPFQYLRAGYSINQWEYILYIVLVGTIAPFGLYFVGINYMRSTRAMITSTLEPIAAGFFAFFFIGEKLEPLQISGGILVISAIVLLQLHREQDALAPAVVRSSLGDSRG